MDHEKINQYIAGIYADSLPVDHQQYVEDTLLKDFTPTIDEDVVRFIQLVICLLRPQRVLEIGTSIGFSTVTMAEQVREYDGCVTTVEFDELVARQAQENFERLGLADVINLRLGDARRVLPELQGEYDLIFMDADKNLYAPLLPECVRLLRSGGVFLADDTLFPVLDLDPKWQDLKAAIDIFNQAILGWPELESTLLPIGDGLTVAVKR